MAPNVAKQTVAHFCTAGKWSKGSRGQERYVDECHVFFADYGHGLKRYLEVRHYVQFGSGRGKVRTAAYLSSISHGDQAKIDAVLAKVA